MEENAFEKNISLEQAVEKYSDKLLFFIMGYVKDETVAEDILSETFLKLLISKSRFLGNCSVKTYLYKIARNNSIDYIRKRNRRGIPLDIDTFYAFTSYSNFSEAEAESPEEVAIKNERNEKIYKAMNELPCQYKEALYLMYFENLSQAQIASVTKSSIKQIQNRLCRAREKLKSVLQKEGFCCEDI